MVASVTAINAPRAARRLGSRLLDAWLCVIAISDYPHFVANACTGSRFLRGWQRGATQPFGGRKHRLARAAVAFGYALPWLMMGVAQLVGL